MRESIGTTFLYNIIFIFILLVFGLLTATLSYYKGYKVNTRILKAIKDNSGYNDNSYKEIERILSGIGYTVEGNGAQRSCPDSRDNMPRVLLSNKNSSYMYCVYYNSDEANSKEKNSGKHFYSYGVVTYIYMDLPIIGKLKIPVYTKGERIYKFTGSCQLDSGEACSRVYRR